MRLGAECQGTDDIAPALRLLGTRDAIDKRALPVHDLLQAGLKARETPGFELFDGAAIDGPIGHACHALPSIWQAILASAPSNSQLDLGALPLSPSL